MYALCLSSSTYNVINEVVNTLVLYLEEEDSLQGLYKSLHH